MCINGTSRGRIWLLMIGTMLLIASPVGSAWGQTAINTVSTDQQTTGSAPKPSPSPAASPNKIDADKKKPDDDASPDPGKAKRGSLLVVPIPIISPTFGSGLVLGLGYVFRLKTSDKISPLSTVAGAAAFTSSGTRGGVIAAHLYFAENKYQTTVAFGKGRAIYDYYGIGVKPGQPSRSVSLRQGGTILFAEFMANLWKDIFIGPRYQYRKLTSSNNGIITPGGFEVPPFDLESTSAALGFHLQRDRRDNAFYPTKGSVWNITADFFAKPLGSRREYQVYKASYNGYLSIGQKQVLAYRGSVCSVSERTPFFDLCMYGSSSDLRGYTMGQYQDRRMFAAQTEYRRELWWRLGFAAFAGFGGVAQHWNEFHFNELLPAAGVGLRFKLDKKDHINYRIDLGYGRSGHTLTMSVTEAF